MRPAGPVADLVPEQLDPDQRAVWRKIHETIAKASDDVGRRYTFNTAIAAIIEMLNTLRSRGDESPQGRALHREGLRAATALLAPGGAARRTCPLARARRRGSGRGRALAGGGPRRPQA